MAGEINAITHRICQDNDGLCQRAYEEWHVMPHSTSKLSLHDYYRKLLRERDKPKLSRHDSSR